MDNKKNGTEIDPVTAALGVETDESILLKRNTGPRQVMLINGAPSDVKSSLDGSFYPR